MVMTSKLSLINFNKSYVVYLVSEFLVVVFSWEGKSLSGFCPLFSSGRLLWESKEVHI